MAEPTQVTISGAREGRNCRLSVSGYSSITVQAVALALVVNINASDEDAGSRRAYYPFSVVSDSFSLIVIHNSWAQREAFNAWIRGYMNKVIANDKIGGTIKVELPVRRFVRNAVPKGTVNYGARFDDVSFTTTIQFVGALNPLSAVGQSAVSGVSYYKPPTNDPTAKYFYPSGTQVSGAESLQGTIFDSSPAAASTGNLQQQYKSAIASGALPPSLSYSDFQQLALGY